MKARGFDFVAPDTTQQVCEFLSDASCESRIIAGGQTLTPMLAMRVAQPSRLIDLSGIKELGAIDVRGRGVSVSASVTQSALEDWLLKIRIIRFLVPSCPGLHIVLSKSGNYMRIDCPCGSERRATSGARCVARQDFCDGTEWNPGDCSRGFLYWCAQDCAGTLRIHSIRLLPKSEQGHHFWFSRIWIS